MKRLWHSLRPQKEVLKGLAHPRLGTAGGSILVICTGIAVVGDIERWSAPFTGRRHGNRKGPFLLGMSHGCLSVMQLTQYFVNSCSIMNVVHEHLQPFIRPRFFGLASCTTSDRIVYSNTPDNQKKTLIDFPDTSSISSGKIRIIWRIDYGITTGFLPCTAASMSTYTPQVTCRRMMTTPILRRKANEALWRDSWCAS